MAFDLKKFFTTEGRSLARTPEAVREAANALLAAPTGITNNSSFKDWARDALGYLNATNSEGTRFGLGSDEERLNAAYEWITGKMQPSKAKSVFSGFTENLQKMQDDYRNAAENLANITDFRNISAEEQARVLASDTYQEALAKVQRYENEAKFYLDAGVEVAAPTLTRDPNGNYSSITERPASTSRPGALGNTGEGLNIRQQPDGTFSVIGANTNTVYKAGLANESDANAFATGLQSGSTPTLAGRPDLLYGPPQPGQTVEPFIDPATGATVTPRVATAEEIAQHAAGTLPAYNPGGQAGGSTGGGSSILDEAGVNYNGLTPSEIEDLEAVYTNAGNDQTVMDKVFAMQEVTDEDTKSFLDRAREFITGKGSAYEQTIRRAKENYERTLENQALERESQMAQEKLAAQEAVDSNSANAAEGGLAFSGIRAKAQKKIEDQARNIAESSRRSFDFNLGTYQRDTEDYLGSANLAGAKLPTIQGVDLPKLSEGIRGSLERQAETDVQLKADQLQAQDTAINQEILAGEGGTSLY